jgi:hypothetical protein
MSSRAERGGQTEEGYCGREILWTSPDLQLQLSVALSTGAHPDRVELAGAQSAPVPLEDAPRVALLHALKQLAADLRCGTLHSSSRRQSQRRAPMERQP